MTNRREYLVIIANRRHLRQQDEHRNLMVDGYRESAQSWKEQLLDFKQITGLGDRARVGTLSAEAA